VLALRRRLETRHWRTSCDTFVLYSAGEIGPFSPVAGACAILAVHAAGPGPAIAIQFGVDHRASGADDRCNAGWPGMRSSIYRARQASLGGFDSSKPDAPGTADLLQFNRTCDRTLAPLLRSLDRLDAEAAQYWARLFHASIGLPGCLPCWYRFWLGSEGIFLFFFGFGFFFFFFFFFFVVVFGFF